MRKLAVATLVTMACLSAPAFADSGSRCTRMYSNAVANGAALRVAVADASAAGIASGSNRQRRYDYIFANRVEDLSSSLRSMSQFAAAEPSATTWTALRRDLSNLRVREGVAVTRDNLAELARIADAAATADNTCAVMEAARR